MRISDWSSDVCSSDLADRGMAHRLEQLPPGIVWNRKQAVEALIDRLTHCIKGRFQTDGGVHHRGINRHRKAGGRTACRPDQAEYALCAPAPKPAWPGSAPRSEEHTSELQSLMRISYAVFCLKKKKPHNHRKHKI